MMRSIRDTNCRYPAMVPKKFTTVKTVHKREALVDNYEKTYENISNVKINQQIDRLISQDHCKALATRCAFNASRVIRWRSFALAIQRKVSRRKCRERR
jgi:hypothetical protein